MNKITMKNIRANALLISHDWLITLTAMLSETERANFSAMLKQADCKHYKLVAYLDNKGE